MDSVTSNLTKDEIIAEISLMSSADFNNKNFFVLVEGKDDMTFLNRKLASNVYLFESFSGKEGVKEIVKYFNKDNIIGICDKDYDDCAENHIFYYDCSCLEMMLISCDEAFESFFNANYKGEDDYETIRKKVFDNLKWITYLRYINSKKAIGINFKCISFPKSFDENNKCIDLSKLMKQVFEVNKDLPVKFKKELKDASLFCKSSHDLNTYYSMIQGHDFICCFKCFCDAEKNQKNHLSIESLTLSLMSSYRKSDFKKTNLYDILKSYNSAIL